MYRETHFFCKKFTQPYIHFHNCYDCDNMLHCAKNSINFRIKTEPCNSTYPAFVYIYSICSMTWPFHLLQPRQAWVFLCRDSDYDLGHLRWWTTLLGQGFGNPISSVQIWTCCYTFANNINYIFPSDWYKHDQCLFFWFLHYRICHFS